MKRISLLLLFVSVWAWDHAAAQSGQSAARLTDLYHVHFTKAALGKADQLGDFLKMPMPKSPMPGHLLVLRHQDGEAWDYAVIEHLGKKVVLDASGNPPPPGARDLSEWHTDTFASGPPWADFTRAMGIGGKEAAKTKDSVYVLSLYRAAPGHRAQLEKMLSEPGVGGRSPAGEVLIQHLEGGPWQYLTLSHFNSWQDFARGESNSRAQSLKAGGGWLQLRDHVTLHSDTVADRIAP